MVVIARPFRFVEDDPRPMLAHLDSWARAELRTPEAWSTVLERCGQWADYSPRNQTLLASYGVVGVVAGSATWDLVPSAEPGRNCAVRGGEHGLPIRAPVAGEGGGRVRDLHTAPSHRWEPVFAAEQLARRPGPGTLASPVVPQLDGAEWVEAVRVAAGRVLGRTPRSIDDPAKQLAKLAARVTHGANRMRLSPELAAQAAWLVADRVGLASGSMPEFAPASLTPRERWHSIADVRHSVQVVTVGVSHALGVDLASSPLPRHAAVDERQVAPGRRNYLSAADLSVLPVGEWSPVGPYSKSEWLARGVAGANGTAEFLRVNDRSYLAVYESRDGATWRLETTGRGAHQGLVYEGTSDSMSEARDAARSALRDRFPEVAQAIDLGGSVGRHPSAGVLEFERTGPAMTADRVDQATVDLLRAGWDRGALVEMVGHRLIERDRRELAATDDPARLAELMAATGVLRPSTMLDVLHAEGASAAAVYPLVATIGMPVADAIRSMHDLWDVDRLDAAAGIGASVEDLRAAGCTMAELLAAAPRETLRSLDSHESMWETVAPTMLEAGYTVSETIAHLAAHAPTAEAFAIGVAAVEDDPVLAFSAVTRRVQPEDLAALSERYGLSPEQTAAALASAMVSTDLAIDAISIRCDHDPVAIEQLAVGVLGVDADIFGFDAAMELEHSAGDSMSL